LVRQLAYGASVPGAISAAGVMSIAEDLKGNLWIGTDGGGLDLARPDGTVVKVFRHDPSDSASLPANTVYAISVDSVGRVWLGTDGGGLVQVLGSAEAPDSLRFQVVSRDEGLSSDTIWGLLSDAAGHLWLSGNAGHGYPRHSSDSTNGDSRNAGNSGHELSCAAAGLKRAISPECTQGSIPIDDCCVCRQSIVRCGKLSSGMVRTGAECDGGYFPERSADCAVASARCDAQQKGFKSRSEHASKPEWKTRTRLNPVQREHDGTLVQLGRSPVMRKLIVVAMVMLNAVGCFAQEALPISAAQAVPIQAPPAQTEQTQSQMPADVQPQTITIPPGTIIPVTLTSVIKLKSTHRGDVVRAVTAFPVTVGTQVAIPAGTFVEGTFDKFPSRNDIGQVPPLVHFNRIVFSNGYTVNITAEMTQADRQTTTAGTPGIDLMERAGRAVIERLCGHDTVSEKTPGCFWNHLVRTNNRNFSDLPRYCHTCQRRQRWAERDAIRASAGRPSAPASESRSARGRLIGCPASITHEGLLALAVSFGLTGRFNASYCFSRC